MRNSHCNFQTCFSRNERLQTCPLFAAVTWQPCVQMTQMTYCRTPGNGASADTNNSISVKSAKWPVFPDRVTYNNNYLYSYIREIIARQVGTIIVVKRERIYSAMGTSCSHYYFSYCAHFRIVARMLTILFM